MITGLEPVFPNNAVDLIALRANFLDPDHATDPDAIRVFKRPLRETDPQQSIGVFAAQWNPDEESYELLGGPTPRASEPTLQTYLIAVQAFVKDFQEERGLARHSIMSKLVRSMLYRDNALRVGLASLSVEMNGSVERTQRWGIRIQRFLSNEIDGDFLYLSTLEFWLETETV